MPLPPGFESTHFTNLVYQGPGLAAAEHFQNDVFGFRFLIAITSLILIFGLNYFETFINPAVSVEAASFAEPYGTGIPIGLMGVIFPATGGLFVIGYVLFCVDMLHAKTLGRGAPLLTIVGGGVFGAGLSEFLPMLV